MNYLYLLINIATLSVPFIASFHPKIQFYKNHRSFFAALVLSSLVFIGWDIVFTEKEVWGFSDSYTLGLGLFGLPLEEWFFFLSIPYASLFLHLQLDRFGWLNSLEVSNRLLVILSSVVLTLVAVVGILNIDRSYTLVNAAVFVVVYSLALIGCRPLLKRFLPSFVIILIPFFIVNGLLTGSLLDEPIVWYNDNENLGIRLGTIPLEDVFYAFSMLMLPLMLYSGKVKQTTRQNL